VTIGRRPACFECRHFGEDEFGAPVCTAFPAGVPREIYFEGFDHRQPFPGDQGIRWEPAEGVAGYPPELDRAPTSGD
jgi:hypothetical protein